MKIGDTVDALYNDAWYRGIVQQVGGHINLKKNVGCTIKLTDGTTIYSPEKIGNIVKNKTLNEGDAVKIKTKKGWQLGSLKHIKKKNNENIYKVHLQDEPKNVSTKNRALIAKLYEKQNSKDINNYNFESDPELKDIVTNIMNQNNKTKFNSNLKTTNHNTDFDKIKNYPKNINQLINTQGNIAEKYSLLTNQKHNNNKIINQPINNHMMPNHMMPNHMMPNHMMPNHMMPNHMMSNHMMPNHMMPNHMMPNHMMPNHMMHDHMMPNHMMPNHMPVHKPKQINNNRVTKNNVPNTINTNNISNNIWKISQPHWKV